MCVQDKEPQRRLYLNIKGIIKLQKSEEFSSLFLLFNKTNLEFPNNWRV